MPRSTQCASNYRLYRAAQICCLETDSQAIYNNNSHYTKFDLASLSATVLYRDMTDIQKTCTLLVAFTANLVTHNCYMLRFLVMIHACHLPPRAFLVSPLNPKRQHLRGISAANV